MTKIISVLNQKGGCGKTTIAVNLAACLKQIGYSVIVLDADPQGSATKWLSQNSSAMIDVLTLDLTQSAKKVKELINTYSNNLDYVLIDCPPELREPSMLASLLSEMVLIPVTPSALDIWAAQGAISLARDALELNNGKKPTIVLIPSKLQANTLMSRELKQTLETLHKNVVPTGITQRIVLSECVVAGQTVNQYKPNTPAHNEFIDLMKYILTILKNTYKEIVYDTESNISSNETRTRCPQQPKYKTQKIA